MNDVYSRYFVVEPPARATGRSRASRGVRVEIDATAVLERGARVRIPLCNGSGTEATSTDSNPFTGALRMTANALKVGVPNSLRHVVSVG